MTDIFQDPTADPVADLVGEGKKFKDVAALAKGKLESDAFIKRLEDEKAAMRAELDKKVRADEALEELKREIAELKEQGTQRQPKEHTTPALTEADVRALIARTITEDDSRRTASDNIKRANAAVVDHYGSLDKASEAVKGKARELNVSVDFLKEMAAKSPAAFAKLVTDKVEVPDNGPNFKGTVNTESRMTPSNAKEGTKEFFDAILAKSPKNYWSQPTQKAIWAAMKAGTYQTGEDN